MALFPTLAGPSVASDPIPAERQSHIRETLGAQGMVVVAALRQALGMVAAFLTAPIDCMHFLVMDSEVVDEFRQELGKHGVTLIVAS